MIEQVFTYETVEIKVQEIVDNDYNITKIDELITKKTLLAKRDIMRRIKDNISVLKNSS